MTSVNSSPSQWLPVNYGDLNAHSIWDPPASQSLLQENRDHQMVLEGVDIDVSVCRERFSNSYNTGRTTCGIPHHPTQKLQLRNSPMGARTLSTKRSM